VSRTGPTFAEFYAAYLTHHRHPLNRALHLLAKLLAAASLLGAARQRSVLLLLAAPALAVAPCWLGHLWFEGNRPVSWERPSASLLGTLAGWARRLAAPARRLAPRRRPASPGLPPPPAAVPPTVPSASPASLASLASPEPPAAGAGRAYYSFLADLRMCGEMLVSRGGAVADSGDTSEPM
jgi:hypothetical protein